MLLAQVLHPRIEGETILSDDGESGAEEEELRGEEFAEDEEVVEDEDEREVVDPQAAPLAHYGTDFDVHGLVRRLDSKDILIPTFDPGEPLLEPGGLEGFQRRFVWRKPQMDRFIESLLLGYPVPGIFLVEQPNKTLLVLDGQQRLRTLWAFLKDQYQENPYRLENAEADFNGLSYPKLGPEQRRAFDNTFIHATIVKYEASDQGNRSVYQLFERLNTGGTNLQAQEIRVALYHGSYVNLVRQLNDFEAWRALYGQRSERLKDQELILRVLSLIRRRDKYKRPLKKFLNESLEEFLHISSDRQSEDKTLFEGTCQLILDGIGRRAFRLKRGYLNAALLDSVMVGVAARIQAGPIESPDQLGSRYEELMENGPYLESLRRATTNEESVASRLLATTSLFGSVP